MIKQEGFGSKLMQNNASMVKISDVFSGSIFCLRLHLWIIRSEKDNSSSVSLL